MSKNFPTV